MTTLANRLLLAALALSLAAGCARRETQADRAAAEGVLLQSLGIVDPSLDPHLAQQLAEGTILRALLEGLVVVDPRTLEPRPGVARTWETSDDGLVYTFQLRPDARWSDGSPVTAHDFVRSFERALTPSLGAPNAYFMHVLAGAADFHAGRTTDFAQVGAEALDDLTLRLELEAPCPHFLALLTHFVWLPVHAPTVLAHGEFASRSNRWALPQHYVGNGPFVPGEHVSEQFLRTTPNPHYWDRDSVRLRGVVFHSFSVVAEEPAFRSGRIHITDALPIAKLDTYRRDRPDVLRVAPSFGTYFYRINVTRPPLDDARVRRALSAALDRELLTGTLLNGVYEPARSFTPPGPGGYTPPALAVDDAALARSLLAEAGYPQGAGLRNFEILFNTSENHRMIAEAVQEIWRRELGVSPVLANQEDGVYRDNRRQLNYDVSRASWFGDFLDPVAFLEIFTTGNPNNQTGWSHPEFDALVHESSRTLDRARRLDLLGRAEAILLHEAPIIPVFVYSTVRLVDPRVDGWHDNLLDQHPYQYISIRP
ncbi:peptide ABC transporter substrate-binding protein [Congregicoccus parvus]|uniref:peptide ABC transporter substrate-binding protein n=1 Tax=Congregicoccus parvus TaxID=3081749 RepID=UPI003FA5551B